MARNLFIGRKAATNDRIHSKHGKEIDGDESTGCTFWIACTGEDRFAAHEKRHVDKTMALRAPVREIRIRDEAGGFSSALIILPKEGEAFRVWIRKRPEKRGIREAENG